MTFEVQGNMLPRPNTSHPTSFRKLSHLLLSGSLIRFFLFTPELSQLVVGNRTKISYLNLKKFSTYVLRNTIGWFLGNCQQNKISKKKKKKTGENIVKYYGLMATKNV